MPSDIELIKTIIEDKKTAIKAILNNQPYTPIASEATLTELQDLEGRLSEAIGKLQPEE
jgi:hypothetical protein